MNVKRDLQIILLALVIFYIVFQVIFFPIRWQSCKDMSHAAAVNPSTRNIRIRDIMCSPWKFLGVFDVLRTLSALGK